MEFIEKVKKFDFCDGQIESVTLDGDSAIMRFKSWQEKTLQFTFHEVVFFKCLLFGCDISEVSIKLKSIEIDEAIKNIEEAGGKPEGYNNYSFCQMNFIGVDGLQCVIVFLTVDFQEV